MTPAFWRELQAILDRGFTGQLVLHCSQGTVVKYEKHETLRPAVVSTVDQVKPKP